MDEKIKYVIIRSKRKSTSLVVRRNGSVEVHAPYRVSERSIEYFVNKNLDWIRSKLKKYDVLQEEKEKNLSGGECVLYLGNSCRLVETDVDTFKPFDNFIACPKGFTQAQLVVWYKKTAADFFNARVKLIAELNGFSFSVIKLSDGKSRWGYCTSKKVIGLNWRLIMTPPSVMDSVIVHELCHTRQMNHGDAFWKDVYFIMSDYDQRHAWLKKNAYILDLYR